MNYTEKYHLPQWEENDRVMRTDFNQAMAGIEGGIAKAQSTASEGLAKANTLPYAVGRYKGNDGAQTIEVGFKPRLSLFPQPQEDSRRGYMYECYFQCCQTAAVNTAHSIQFVENGFIVNPNGNNSYYPQLSLATKDYEYIAFR